MRVALAATVHDTEGRLAPAIPREAAALAATFAGICPAARAAALLVGVVSAID